MKYHFIIASLFILSFGAAAQQPVQAGKETKTLQNKKNILDHATIRCAYLFTKKTNAADQSPRRDTQFLEIGTKISRFYDPARLGRDSILVTSVNNKSPQDIKSMSIYDEQSPIDISKMQGTIGSRQAEGESYQIYKGRTAGKITVVDYADVLSKPFQYEDETGVLPWKILTGTDTILSYTCQKAVLNFRGRNYTAWFTTDIPVNDGPWKFSGLPGLILKVEDQQQLFSFTLIGIEQLKNPKPILMNEAEHIKCSRSDFEKQKKKAGGGVLYNFTAGNMIIAKVPANNSYQSMELE